MRKLLAIAALAVLTSAQTPRPAYDVTSVKPNTSGTFLVMIRNPPGRFSATNITFRMLLRSAYNLPDFRMIGGPSWMETDRFDVEATAGQTSGPGNAAESRLMQQALLADRFKLRAHMEKRDQPIYLLVRARQDGKLGDEIKPAGSECLPMKVPTGFPPPPPPPPGGAPQNGPGCPSMLGTGNGAISGRKLSMDRLATILSPAANRVIVDRTNLSGLYDLDLRWVPDFVPDAAVPGLPPPPVGDPNAPPLFTALQEQLGLKLESSRGPVDVLVIDGVEKPSAD